MKKMIALVACLVPMLASAQISPEDAAAKLKEREAARAGATTKPTSAPATKPAKAMPKRVVIALDGGGAMMSDFDEARRKTAQLLGGLEPTQLFDVTASTGDSSVRAFRRELVPATTESLMQASIFINGLAPRGTVSMEDLVKASLKLQPDVLYLMCEAIRTPDNAKAVPIRTNVPIHVIVFSAEDGVTKFLLDLAKSSGGDCVDANGKPVTAEYKSREQKAREKEQAKDKDREKGVILKP